MAKKKPIKKAKPTPKKSTALAKRSTAITPEVLPATTIDQSRPLGQGADFGMFGQEIVPFTKEERAILSEPIPVSEVRVLPSGIVYLSHPSYTRWLNRSVGMGNWICRPVGMPDEKNGQVVVPYTLFIHQKRAAHSFGEQDYFPDSNKKQTYGDAVEATNASGLRRCMKHLGVGLELWDKVWGYEFVKEHCVAVSVVTKRSGTQIQWRRKVDPPLEGEQIGVVPGSEPPPAWAGGGFEDDFAPKTAPKASPAAVPAKAPPVVPPVPSNGHAINKAQLDRLWRIIQNSGRNEAAIKAWLTGNGIAGTKEVLDGEQYARVCAEIEAPGPLKIWGKA